MRLLGNSIVGMMGDTAPAATITYVSQNSSESNLTTYTFTAQSIGTEASDRFVIVGVYALANTNVGNITGVTCGGTTMTELLQQEDASGFSDFAIYGVLKTSGTTADIVVTMSGAPDRLGIDVWRANKLVSETPTDTLSVNTASVDLTGTITVQDNGFVLGCSGNENLNVTHTWTNLTERHDDEIGSLGSSMTGASDEYGTGQNVTITQSPSSSQSRQSLLSIAMR